MLKILKTNEMICENDVVTVGMIPGLFELNDMTIIGNYKLGRIVEIVSVCKNTGT